MPLNGMSTVTDRVCGVPLFTPSVMDGAVLDALTVGSEEVLNTLVVRIRAAVREGSRPHTLLVAPTGAGKTHILRVALHRTFGDSATDGAVLPVVLPESGLGIGRYSDLLVEIARVIDPMLLEQAKLLRGRGDPVGIEELIIHAGAGRMVLLVVENLDRVFRGLGAAGQGSLRAWVETSGAVLVVASTPALFEGVSSRMFPWYGSFIVEKLPGLSIDDAVTVIERGARRRGIRDLEEFVISPRGRSAVAEVWRRVGVAPRVWHLLAGLVDAQDLAAVEPAIEVLLDRLVEYYRPRLWGLPGGEQRLVTELARGEGARTVAELAAAVGVSSQSASVALRRLAAGRWVVSSKRGDDQRQSWYDLTDPLVREFVQYRQRGFIWSDARSAAPED
ncbi:MULTISPECIES: ArsR/SmtB family transcription factor [Mycobacterium avium complex (MAC)]|uniref:ArsR/SmtB family transcription factor n=1 Tax=Mycobacterium avium complex (MAC) TaxID=120793 RepID=UPI001CF5E5EE|nr:MULTISPECIES: helix-turn-helix domain-containing protein [Mycobacterium avium complex (MAC)]UCN12854.1 MarR family transcriptional regulator [Mycobacterium intracellulare subsp. chimaera]